MPDTQVTVTDIYGHGYVLPGPYRTVAAIKRANKEAGRFFFSPDTMRFFDSRIESRVIGGRMFVTSEQFEDSRGERPYPREFNVRIADDDGDVNSLTDRKFESVQAAEEFARSLLG